MVRLCLSIHLSISDIPLFFQSARFYCTRWKETQQETPTSLIFNSRWNERDSKQRERERKNEMNITLCVIHSLMEWRQLFSFTSAGYTVPYIYVYVYENIIWMHLSKIKWSVKFIGNIFCVWYHWERRKKYWYNVLLFNNARFTYALFFLLRSCFFYSAYNKNIYIRPGSCFFHI